MTTTTTHQQGESVDLDKLSADIMNLPCNTGITGLVDFATAYKFGHQAACYAAAELVNERASQPAASDHDLMGDCDYYMASGERPPQSFYRQVRLLIDRHAYTPAASDAQPGADERALPKFSISRFSDTGRRGLLLIAEGPVLDSDIEAVRAAFATPAASGQAGATVAAEPTKEMLRAGMKHFSDKRDPATKAWQCYRDMTAAAPASPATQQAAMDARDVAKAAMKEALSWVEEGRPNAASRVLRDGIAAMSASVSEADGSGKSTAVSQGGSE